MVYNYLRLNALAPQARAAARGLSEKRLRPILSTPPHGHAEILAIAAAHGLDDKALASLCQVYRRNDEDEIQRVLAGLRRGVPGKGRTAVSWEPLVSALPLDVDRRLAAMDAELAALPPRQRDKRLAQVRQQIPLLRQVLVHFEDYDRRYSIRDE